MWSFPFRPQQVIVELYFLRSRGASIGALLKGQIKATLDDLTQRRKTNYGKRAARTQMGGEGGLRMTALSPGLGDSVRMLSEL